MRTLLATVALLLAAAPTPAQHRPPYYDPVYGYYGASYGIAFWGGASVIDWYGEPMVLLWSLPSRAHEERLPIVTLDENEVAFIFPAVGIEMVGWAAYDPRPCAVGSRAVLSAPANDYFVEVSAPEFGASAAYMSTAIIQPDGFAFSFPDLPYPVLRPWYFDPGDYTGSDYGVSYCRESAPWGGCTSECQDGSGPYMGFILGRLVLL